MREFGLIGKTLSHSFSKNYFEEKFRREQIEDATYSLFEIADIKDITNFLRQHPNLVGFNVTIPYKQTIIPYLDALSEEAAAVGAVNTVAVQSIDGKIITKGYNTDTIGFRHTLENVELPDHALILGTGGAAAEGARGTDPGAGKDAAGEHGPDAGGYLLVYQEVRLPVRE